MHLVLSSIVAQKICNTQTATFWKSTLTRFYRSSASPTRQSWFNSDEVEQHIRKLTDLTRPASWYPLARSLRRKIIAHLGPTNSGKTYHALKALKEAKTGIYCGPLRLLACEVSDRLIADGVPCHLLTGQEVRHVQGANHTACTIEMTKLEESLNVAVLDEIQMLADPQRGWSWTRALLGVVAEEVHVCGDASALGLLERIVEECGDTLEVVPHRRLSQLVVMGKALNDLDKVQSGDCLVAFSRRELHGLKREVVRRGILDCSVVYGALPPDARRHQAERFNKSDSGSSVIVASDAVGMGLNLNIKRIVLASTSKFDGKGMRPLTAPELKQIAGRAGRHSSAHDTGYVTALHSRDMRHLHECLSQPTTPLIGACLLPRSEDLVTYAAYHDQQPFSMSLKQFAEEASLSKGYFFGEYSNMLRIASMLRHLKGLSLVDLHIFCSCPADMYDTVASSALLDFATQYVTRGKVFPSVLEKYQLTIPESEEALKKLEEVHRVFDLYCWLSYRFPAAFLRREIAILRRSRVGEMIEAGLDQLAHYDLYDTDDDEAEDEDYEPGYQRNRYRGKRKRQQNIRKKRHNAFRSYEDDYD